MIPFTNISKSTVQHPDSKSPLTMKKYKCIEKENFILFFVHILYYVQYTDTKKEKKNR